MTIKALKELVKQAPLLRSVMKLRYDRTFSENKGGQLYRGIFATYAEAAASSPVEQVGYDQSAPAQMYQNFMTKIENYDYPVLFWLQKFITEEPESACHGIFDYGGHVGIKFYAYSQLLTKVPPWIVCDVAAVVERGKQLATARREEGIAFTCAFHDVSRRAVLMCLGSLQYIEPSLAAQLGELEAIQRPRYVIVNTTPFTANDEPAFYTLNGIGTAFCPYKIQNERAFVKAMDNIGYALLDRWENPGRVCSVPFQNQREDFKYLGMRFSQKA